MNPGLETSGTTPVRVLVVGSSPWTRTVTTTLADRDGAVTVEDRVHGLDDGRPESTDCVLTDVREVCSTVAQHCPVVYAADDVADDDVEALLGDGVTDVIDKATSEAPSLLEHRLRQAVHGSSTRAAVEQREAWYRSLIERSSDLLVVFEESGRMTYVSPSVERVVGSEPNELLGERVLEIVHPDDRDDVVEAFEAVCTDEPGSTRTVEYRCRHDDENWYVHQAVLTNRLEDPVVGGIIASIRDVTRYRRIERELSESVERVTDAFFALDTEWRFTYVNDRAEAIFDHDQEELLGREFLEVLPGMEGTAFEEQSIEAMRRQEPRTIERYYDPYDIWIEARIYPSRSGLSVYFRDVTDRVERERELAERTERLQLLVENVPVILFALADDGTFTLAEGRALENIGFEPGEVVGESLFDAFGDSPAICEDARTALAGDPVSVRREIGDRIFETWYRPVTRDGAVDRVIGVAVDVTERVQYQEALNGLHEATTHLLTVESKQAACEYIVDVAGDVLDLDSVVYRFDDQQNELLPAAYSTGLEREIGMPSRLGPNEGHTWNAFVTGTTAVVDDVESSDPIADGTTDAHSGLYVPLGEHGVLVAVSPHPESHDEDTVELAKLFAATAEAALDRIGRTRRLHDRERELKRQNTHLERMNHANRVRQDVEGHLLVADSRDEIERGICERLADLESCSMAWIGEPDPGGNHVRQRARAGLERGYLESVTVTTVDDSAAEPTGRAVRNRTPVAVENVAGAVRDGAWRAEALSRNFQSVYAVPLIYDDYLYGVVSVYGDEPDAFDGTLRSTLAELGETIAYAIDAVKRKNALLRDGITEVELELGPESTLCRLADRLEARVSFEGAAPAVDDSAVVFVAVDAPVDEDDVVSSVDAISDASVIADTEAETLLQLHVTGPFLGSIVTGHGGTLREFVADESERRAIVELPDTVELRDVLSDVNRRGLSASMVARRERTTSDRPTLDAPARTTLLETLTDRQREVVQTAYHGGFFEWPRQTTGEGIAASLDISSPAFHKHVRAAERKLFAALFEGSMAEVN